MSILEFVFPDLPRNGRNRRRYLVGQSLLIVVEAALLVFIVWLAALYLVAVTP